MNRLKMNKQTPKIGDTLQLFDSVWTEIEGELGKENLRFPSKIFWLNGAPGSGKGTQTDVLLEVCGLTAQPIVISDLLQSPEAKRFKDQGIMVGDREVANLIFRKLLKPEFADGAIVDGFPRTQPQVDCIRALHRKIVAFSDEMGEISGEVPFPKSEFHVIVFFVDETVSVQRQLYRGRKAAEEAKEAGAEVEELRKTDQSEEAARHRYQVFEETTYEPLKSLRGVFPFHFIDSHGTIEEVRECILEEFK